MHIQNRIAGFHQQHLNQRQRSAMTKAVFYIQYRVSAPPTHPVCLAFKMHCQDEIKASLV